MVFNSKTNRVAFEPGDEIKCRNSEDADILIDILNDRQIKWIAQFDLHKNCFVIEILSDKEAADQ